MSTTRGNSKTVEELRTEYDQLFETEPIRDEARGYQWIAAVVQEEKSLTGRVLDIACGGGYFLAEMQKLGSKGSRFVGMDFSRSALQLAEKECPEANYVLGVGEKLPFRGGSFEAISCLGSLEHFFDIPQGLREMQRVARKDARFFILVPNLFWYKDILSVLLRGERKERNQSQEMFATLGEWKRTIASSGLRIVKTLKYNGIAKRQTKQWLKNLLIPLRFSYHFLFVCAQDSQ